MNSKVIAEKARKKKEYFDAINECTKSASQNRDALTDGKKRKWIDRDENLD